MVALSLEPLSKRSAGLNALTSLPAFSAQPSAHGSVGVGVLSCTQRKENLQKLFHRPKHSFLLDFRCTDLDQT